MTSCLVPRWGLVLLSGHTDCSWELGALPLLPGHPAMAFWLLVLGGHSWPSAFLAPVQMTLNRPQMEFSVTTWPLQSYGNVPGAPSCWVGCGGSVRPSSLQTFPLTLLYAARSPPISYVRILRLLPAWVPDQKCGRFHPAFGSSILQFWRNMETELF